MTCTFLLETADGILIGRNGTGTPMMVSVDPANS
jgi:hypothetical protein